MRTENCPAKPPIPTETRPEEGRRLLLWVLVIAMMIVVITTSLSAYNASKVQQQTIDNSPKIQQMIKEITASQEHDLLVNEYTDKDGKDRVQVVIVRQNVGRGGFIHIVSRIGNVSDTDPGNPGTSIKDLAFQIDKVVKPDDPEYPKYAAMFVQQ